LLNFKERDFLAGFLMNPIDKRAIENIMKNFLLLLLFSFSLFATAQQITLKKGAIMDGIKVNDTISETFAVYLPKTFEMEKKWPVLFVYDTKGRGKQAISMFKEAAEQQGYILAASNSVNDSLSLSQNILVSSRMFNTLFSMVPIQKNRVYTGGFSDGARLASLVPTFVRQVKGVISCSSPVANREVLSSRNPFHFIGIVGVEDFNYITMLGTEKVLDKLKFPNNLLVFQGGQEWPKTSYITRAFEILTLASMAKGTLPKDEDFIEKTYRNNLGGVSELVTANKPLMADKLLEEMADVYRAFRNVDSLKSSSKTLRKTKQFRSGKRAQNSIFFKESFIKEDYVYYLEEDVITYNYNNLGWWKYQMEKLQDYEKDPDIYEKQWTRKL